MTTTPGQRDGALRHRGVHIRLVLERGARIRSEVSTHPPKIAYRETVTAGQRPQPAQETDGGAGPFGEVSFAWNPAPGAGFELLTIRGRCHTGSSSGGGEGVRQGIVGRRCPGYPLQDLRVVVTTGNTHRGFQGSRVVSAGRKAFLDAITKANPIVLEPVAKGADHGAGGFRRRHFGHLSGHRGRINGNQTATGNQVTISAEVPEAELIDYQTKLKSLTGGKGTYTVNFDHYATVPANVQKSLAEAFRPKSEE